ncbi:MAG: PAS domain S-box protein [Bacillota bacterium]
MSVEITENQFEILLVEDNSNLNDLIVRILKRKGFSVKGVKTGAKALLSLQKGNYDLLLLDYKLPDMTAEKILKELQEDIPFIIISGEGNEKIAVQFMKLGAADYLVKGDEFIDLLPSVVERVLNNLSNKLELKQAYRKINQEKNKLDKILEATIDGFFLLDSKGKFLEANKAFVEMVGYTKQELSQMTVFDIDIRTKQEVTEHLNKVLKSGDDIFETKVKTKDNSIKDIEVSNSVLKVKEDEVMLTGFIRDITERKENMARLRNLNHAIKQSSSIVVITDCDGRIEYVNPNFTEVTGYEFEEVKGKNPKILKSGYTSAEEYQELWETITSEEEWKGELYNQKKNGDFYWELASISAVKDKQGNITNYIKIAKDITERKLKEEKIKYMNYHDDLTGLHNRKFYKKKLAEIDKNKKLPISIIIGDLNGLKITNDVFGHQVGDKLLKEVAQILKKSTREDDIIARWGGDEFGIILPQTSQKVVNRIIERIKMNCNTSDFEPISPYIALGSATKTKAKQNLEEIFKKAEDKMYQDKQEQKKSAENPFLQKLVANTKGANYNVLKNMIKLVTIDHDTKDRLNISDHEIENLFLLAKYNDIGQVTISKEILNKEGVLTKREWIKLKKHPEIGYDIAKNFQELKPISNCILHHHERWDGTGYPEGLAQKEIPLLARLIYILDSLDGLTSPRLCRFDRFTFYTETFSEVEALEVIKGYAGSFFDPQLVAIIEDIIRD